MATHDGKRRRAAERHLSRDHLVNHHPQRVDIAPRIQCLSLGLLRRHVLRRTKDPAGGGPSSEGSCFGDAKVHHRHVAVGPDHDVGGLDVAVHQPAPMGIVQRRGHLPDHVHDAPRGQSPLLEDHLLEGPALQELHGHVNRARLPAKLVNNHNVGMFEVGSQLGLALEPLYEGWLP